MVVKLTGNIRLRELKSRKAKFGFDGGFLTVKNVVEYGKFFESLQTSFDPDLYTAEEAGYHNPEIRIYTDDAVIADWLRNYKF